MVIRGNFGKKIAGVEMFKGTSGEVGPGLQRFTPQQICQKNRYVGPHRKLSVMGTTIFSKFPTMLFLEGSHNPRIVFQVLFRAAAGGRHFFH